MSNKQAEVYLDLFGPEPLETPYKKVVAVYSPDFIDEVMKDLVGLEYIWEWGWVYEWEESDGTISSDVAMLYCAPHNHTKKFKFAWTPLSDLKEPLEYVKD